VYDYKTKLRASEWRPKSLQKLLKVRLNGTVKTAYFTQSFC